MNLYVIAYNNIIALTNTTKQKWKEVNLNMEEKNKHASKFRDILIPVIEKKAPGKAKDCKFYKL